MSNVARFVAGDCCSSCGHVRKPDWRRVHRKNPCWLCGNPQPLWAPQRIVDAALAWLDERERLPTAEDWVNGTPDHPANVTVCKVFGTWNRMLAAAGLASRRKRANPVWSFDTIAASMIDWLLEYGRWPTAADWNAPLNLCDGERKVLLARQRSRPHTNTVLRIFGTWNDAKRHAGWNGVNPNVSREPYTEPRCTGCGAELENNVEGCTVCHNRHRNRARRQAETAAVSTTSPAAASDRRKVAA